jgi:adenylate kinase family enzyme
MKLAVFGNTGSGKTLLINHLSKTLSWEIVSIDDYRRKYSDGSKDGELFARQKFFCAVKKDENQLIECTGFGNVAHGLFEKLNCINEKLICLTLLATKEICIQRIEKRVWDVPFPSPASNISLFLEKVHSAIGAGYIESMWGKRNNTVLISKRNANSQDFEEITQYITKKIQVYSEAGFNDIEMMLNTRVQSYYGNQYLNYQKHVIEKNDKFLDDRTMIINFLSKLTISGNLIDIGAGNCQWFAALQKHLNNYIAIDVNKEALSKVPNNIKIISLVKNIFEDDTVLDDIINVKTNNVLLSFFLSHFSDRTIFDLFRRITSKSIIIIDSVWSKNHKEKYSEKELQEVTRKISDQEHISLPKRFFEFSDFEILAKSNGYSIVNFIEGNYWFACHMEK